MAASTTRSFPGVSAHSASPFQAVRPDLSRPRHVDPQSGHALEKLGHAIEYLTDEYVHDGGDLNDRDPRLEAVQVLMALNRKIYFDCPVIPTLSERFWAYLRGIHLHP